MTGATGDGTSFFPTGDSTSFDPTSPNFDPYSAYPGGGVGSFSSSDGSFFGGDGYGVGYGSPSPFDLTGQGGLSNLYDYSPMQNRAQNLGGQIQNQAQGGGGGTSTINQGGGGAQPSAGETPTEYSTGLDQLRQIMGGSPVGPTGFTQPTPGGDALSTPPTAFGGYQPPAQAAATPPQATSAAPAGQPTQGNLPGWLQPYTSTTTPHLGPADRAQAIGDENAATMGLPTGDTTATAATTGGTDGAAATAAGAAPPSAIPASATTATSAAPTGTPAATAGGAAGAGATPLAQELRPIFNLLNMLMPGLGNLLERLVGGQGLGGLTGGQQGAGGVPSAQQYAQLYREYQQAHGGQAPPGPTPQQWAQQHPSGTSTGGATTSAPSVSTAPPSAPSPAPSAPSPEPNATAPATFAQRFSGTAPAADGTTPPTFSTGDATLDRAVNAAAAANPLQGAAMAGANAPTTTGSSPPPGTVTQQQWNQMPPYERAQLQREAGGGATAAPTFQGTDNWSRWLKAQSYLETTWRNTGNPTSSAKGYFQFINSTANRAIQAGLPDPRAGDYNQQAAATMAYIQRFHPQAAQAIQNGDFRTATALLRGEWPSLPGGSQMQNASRYRTWQQVLGGTQMALQ